MRKRKGEMTRGERSLDVGCAVLRYQCFWLAVLPVKVKQGKQDAIAEHGRSKREISRRLKTIRREASFAQIDSDSRRKKET